MAVGVWGVAFKEFSMQIPETVDTVVIATAYGMENNTYSIDSQTAEVLVSVAVLMSVSPANVNS